MSSGLDKAIKDFVQVIQEAGNKGTSPLDTQAEVRRVEGDIAWVHIPGGVDETPVKLTIAAKAGDVVQVRAVGGRAWITGNATAPPTDDKTAIIAKSLANTAGNRAKTAQKTADQAQIVANSALKGTKENAAQMAQMVINFNGDIENLQDQIDGNITTWFYDVDPAMNLPPVTDWDTDEKKNAHLGDIYYNTVKGYAWRFMKSGITYSWERITDMDVTKALADAAKAQDTADSKRRVFYNTPTVPYDAGDLWVQGSGGDILRCAQAKTSTGSYDRNDWVLASKYTDNSALNTWIEGDFATTIQGLEEGIVDAKVETYYQATDPSTGWSDTQKSEHKGDLWYNSTASVQKYYRWSGSAWQELTATPPQAVFNSIDKKANIYIGTTAPTNPNSGDLWFKGADEPILTYVNNSWIEYNKYTDDTAANTAKAAAATAQSTADEAKRLVAEKANITDLDAANANIKSLQTAKADIDFANVVVGNVSEAWVRNLFIQGGFVSQSGTVYNLVGVRIDGDLINANTVKADKLLLQGDDGLYYAVNVNALGETTASSDAKYQKGIDGSVIVAHSITADQITANNIVGTGGWINLAEGKFKYANASSGNFISWDGKSLEISLDKLNITSSSGISISVGERLADTLADVTVEYADSTSPTTAPTSGWSTTAPAWQEGHYIWSRTTSTNVDGTAKTSDPVCITGNAGGQGPPGADGKDAILLQIDSVNGVQFKNTGIATTLTVTIRYGDKTITKASQMYEAFGSSAYLTWSEKKIGETEFTPLASGDSRIGDNGFYLTIGADDVDEKSVFECELNF